MGRKGGGWEDLDEVSGFLRKEDSLGCRRHSFTEGKMVSEETWDEGKLTLLMVPNVC